MKSFNTWIAASAIFFLSSLSATPAFANYCGAAALGMMSKNFPCDAFLNEVNVAKYPATALLWGSSFGDRKECLIRFLETNQFRPHAVLVYLENGAGRRNRTLESGDLYPKCSVKEWNGYLEHDNQEVYQSFATRLAEVHDFFATYGSFMTQVVIIPSLEDNYSGAAWKKTLEVRQRADVLLLARNPEGSNRDIGSAYFREGHGDGARCSGLTQIANLDGSTLSRSQISKWLRKTSSASSLSHGLLRAPTDAVHPGDSLRADPSGSSLLKTGLAIYFRRTVKGKNDRLV
jgi:hypothetical protein